LCLHAFRVDLGMIAVSACAKTQPKPLVREPPHTRQRPISAKLQTLQETGEL
jgi:hypothetical protein